MISEDTPADNTREATSSPSANQNQDAVVAGDTLQGGHSPRSVEDVGLLTAENKKDIPQGTSAKAALPSVRRGPTRRTPQRRSSMKKPSGCRHKTPRRAVSFNSKGPELHSIVSVEELLDYQEEALQKIWYEEEELDAAQESDIRLVANSTSTSTSTSTADSVDPRGDDEEEETLRGLENKTPEGSMESFMNRANAWDAVLRASFSALDEDLAQLAEQATHRARTTAHQRALQDQKEARDYLQQEQSCVVSGGQTVHQDTAVGVSSVIISTDSSSSITTTGVEGTSTEQRVETNESDEALLANGEDESVAGISDRLSDSLTSLSQEKQGEDTDNVKEATAVPPVVQAKGEERLELTSVSTTQSQAEHDGEPTPRAVFRPLPAAFSPRGTGEDQPIATVTSPKQTKVQVYPEISSSSQQDYSLTGNDSPIKEGKDDASAPRSPFKKEEAPRLPVPRPSANIKLPLPTPEVPPAVDTDKKERKGLPPPPMDWGSFRFTKKTNSKSTSRSGSKQELPPNKSNEMSGGEQLPKKLSKKSGSKRKLVVEESEPPSRSEVVAPGPDESERSSRTAVVSNTSSNKSETAKTNPSAPKSEGRRVSIKDIRMRFENNAVNQASVKDSRRGPPSYKWRKPSAIDLREPTLDQSSQTVSPSDKRRGPPAYKWRKPSVVDLGPTASAKNSRVKPTQAREKTRVAIKVLKIEPRHTDLAASNLGHTLSKEKQETHDLTRSRGASMAPKSLPMVSHKRTSLQSASEKKADESQQILSSTRPVDTIVSPPTSSHRKSPVPSDTVSNTVVSEPVQNSRHSIQSADAVIIAVQSTADAATEVSNASEALAVVSPRNEAAVSYGKPRKDTAMSESPPTNRSSIDAMVAAMQSAAAAANVASDAATSIANLVAGWKAPNRSTSTLDPLAMAACAAANAAAAAATASAAAASAAAAAIEATKSADTGSLVSLPVTQGVEQGQDKDIEWSPTSKEVAPQKKNTRYLLAKSQAPKKRMTASKESSHTPRGRDYNHRMPRNIRRSKSPCKVYKRPVKLPDKLPLQVHGGDVCESTAQLVNKDCPTTPTNKPPKIKRRPTSPKAPIVNKDFPASPKAASKSKKYPASPSVSTKNNRCGSPKSAFKSAALAFESQPKSPISSQVSRRATNPTHVEDPVPRRSLEGKKKRPSLEMGQSTRFFAKSGIVAAAMKKFSPNLVPSRRTF